MLKVKRFVAMIIDQYIVAFIFCLFVLILYRDIEALIEKIDLYILLAMILMLFKDLIFRNASIGKKLMGIEIRNIDGSIPSILTLIIRNITIIIWPIEAIMIIMCDKKIGDIIFKTDVNYSKEYKKDSNNKDKSKLRIKIFIFSYLIICILCFIISFAVSVPSFDRLDTNKFIDYMESKNCKLINELDKLPNEKVDFHYTTDYESCPYMVGYAVINNRDLENNFYNILVKETEHNKYGYYYYRDINYPNYKEYSISSNHYYTAVIMNKDSVLYVGVGKEYEKDAINIIKDLGYYYDLNSISFVIMCGTYVLLLILLFTSWWKLNVKFGRKGWVSLIPIYNMICISEDVFGKKIYSLLFFIPLVNIVSIAVLLYNLGKVFGKSKAYSVFMIFFGLFLVPLLAFDDSKYLGAINEEK